MSQDELDRIAEAYDRRTHTNDKSFARLIRAEREPIYKTFLTEPDRPPLSQIELLEVGCGGGTAPFAEFVREKGKFNVTVVKVLDNKKSNLREILEVTWKKS